MEINYVIIKELVDSNFSISVDESHDISTKEQMAIVLRCIDLAGRVIERFFGLIHVADTNTLKSAIETMLANHGLTYQDFVAKDMMGQVTSKVNLMD